LRNIPFSDVVLATSGKRVIPIDPTAPEDARLIKDVIQAADSFLRLSARTARTYSAEDTRKLSRSLEEEFVAEMERAGLKTQRLGQSGYPDHRLVDRSGRACYFETKVSSHIEESSMRSFYYSGGKKIAEDARHLLVGWGVQRESPEHWRVLSCKLVDLAKLKVSLKIEFNAGNTEIYAPSGILAQIPKLDSQQRRLTS